MSTAPLVPEARRSAPAVLARLALVLFLLYTFLVAIKTLGSAIKAFGKATSGELFDGVSNPFAGLAVGILATVLVQSSSTTTSTIVGMVGSKALALKSAIPMIMGANIGTTITNTLVSIGHVRRSAEFVRAFAAATVHDFFNLMCVVVFLPLELIFSPLERTATAMTETLFGAGGGSYESPIKAAIKSGYSALSGALEGVGLEGKALATALLIVGIVLTMVSLVGITKNMKALIAGRMEAMLNRALSKSGWIGILAGVAITVSVQSSSITTSLLVPMCAAGVLRLENAFPIMLGANIGTTVTALLASMAADDPSGLTIALVHCQFNLLGVALVMGIPRARQIPIRLARRLGHAASRNRLWIVAYVIGVFVLMPLFGYLLFRETAV